MRGNLGVFPSLLDRRSHANPAVGSDLQPRRLTPAPAVRVEKYDTMRPLSFLMTAALAVPGLASDLNLSITSGGSNGILVGPGGVVSYDVTGELSDAANEGLALFAVDLVFDGGDLAQAAAPASDPMQRFASPMGLNNPAGFGGTVIGGDLIQVGGGQNTIANTFAPQPSGMVVTGVAQPGAPEVLVSGMLTAPMTPGVYVLTATNVVANVIREGETGTPFWAVDPVTDSSVTSLEIVVLDCGTFNFCVNTPNSDFAGGASLSSFGTTSIAANNLTLRANDVPRGGFGLFFYGTAQLQTPFGDGFRCVGGQTFRLGRPTQSNANGVVNRPLDVGAPPSPAGTITAGATWFFQYWYRDPGGPGGNGFNTSDGLTATFCP